MVIDDRVRQAEPEAGSAGRPLGCVKRIEKVVEDVVGDADSVVLYGDSQVLVGLVDLGDDANHGAPRLQSIGDQVDERLFDLRPVHGDAGQGVVALEARFRGHVVDVTLRDTESRFDDVVDVAFGALAALGAGEAQQASNDVGAALGVDLDVSEGFGDNIPGVHSVERRGRVLRRHQNAADRIVDLVCDARNQGAYRRQALVASQELLDPFLLRDVVEDADGAADLVVACTDRRQCQQADDLRALVTDARHLASLDGLSAAHPRQHRLGVVVILSGNDGHDIPADYIGRRESRDALCGRVPARDVTVHVGGNDRVGRGFDDRRRDVDSTVGETWHGGYSSPTMRKFQQYLLPGIVFQSVLIGGAYATGREIVQYGARFGARGLWSVVAIFFGFSLMCVLAFEFARVSRTYDYRSFVRALIGPAWPLFDGLFVAMAILVIAVVGAASGDVVEEILGLPYWVGVVAVIFLVGALNAAGRAAIERFKTVGSVVLYAGYVVFAGTVLYERWPQAMAALWDGGGADGGDASGSVATAFGIGVLYVGYNLATMPATFFTLDRQTERRHAVVAGLIGGLMATVPFVLTYLAIMGYYPDPEITGANVPWLVMLRRVGGDGLLAVFAFVIVWTLVETSTGMIHAIVDRVAVNLAEVGRRPMSRSQVAALTVTVLVLAAVLSRLGLIDLVARGYSAMAYGFLLLFALPLCTVGVYRIFQAPPR